MFLRKRSSDLSMQSMDENGRQSGRRGREARRSKMGCLEIFLATRLGLCTAACSGSESRFYSFPYSCQIPESGLVTEPGGPTQPGCRCRGKEQRPHGPTRRLVKHQNVEFGRRDNRQKWGRKNLSPSPSTRAMVSWQEGHGGHLPASCDHLFDCSSSALLGGEGDCCHSQTCVGKAERCMFPSLRLTPQ